MKMAAGTLAAAAGLFGVAAGSASAQSPVPATAAVPYTWRNVAVIAGGFVDGLIFSPAREGLAFARTDIGGAYRWDKGAKRWMPLNDWAGGRDGNLLGCESIGIDPTNADRFYLALGTYTSQGSSNGAIFRTADGGRTYKRTDMPFKMGGNEDGRSAGERLAVDPNNGDVLMMGSRNDGLWRSADRGATWAKVDTFPVTGRTNGVGVVFEIFDRSSGARGKATPVVYAAVSQNGPGLFRSADGGTTWQAVAGQPTGLLPHQGVLAPDGSLYLTYGDHPGPNGMTGGAVWKLNTKNGAWTDVSPQKGSFGYAGLALDRTHPQTVMVTTMDRWNRGDTLFRTRDGIQSIHNLVNVLVDNGPQVADEYVYKVVDALDAVAGETGKTVPQIALNWLLQRPTVATVVIGARNEEQLRQNLGAVGWNLTAEQVARLDAASAVPRAYPYWHQHGFDRNPSPVPGGGGRLYPPGSVRISRQ